MEVFGPYLVYEKLGVGGMAMVHRATKRGIEGFEPVVALKRMLPQIADDVDAVRSFVREAKLASLLRHPNIAQVFDLGRVGNTYYIAMEYVEGYSVLELLRCAHVAGIPLPVDVVLAILIELCDALEYAHTRADDITGEPLGFVHRDVSPANLIITYAGHLKMIDFGVAKADPDRLDTQSGLIKGKLGYMSPEALASGPLDARSDIYSVGVVAHELLTAERLFGPVNTYQAIAARHRGDVVAPSMRNPLVPPDLDDAVLTALAPPPQKRWQTAGELRDAMHAIALVHGYQATCDRTTAWLTETFGDPFGVEAPLAGVLDSEWFCDTDVDGRYPFDTPSTR